MSDPIRIVVADDHDIWRSGMRAELGQAFHVVADAPDADTAIAAARRERPDVVAADLRMPNGGGLAVVEALADEIPVVILTVSEHHEDLLTAVAAGAVGDLAVEEVSEEVRVGPVFGCGFLGCLVEMFSGGVQPEGTQMLCRFVFIGQTHGATSS